VSLELSPYDLSKGRITFRHLDAGVGDGHAVRQRLAGHQVLAAFLQVALDHHAGDARARPR
jgi:hypothetical protein